MRFVLGFCLLLATAAIATAQNAPEHLAPDPAQSREFVDDARRFMQSARLGIDRMAGLTESAFKAAYLAGLKDGALAGALSAAACTFLLMRTKKP